MGDKENMKEVYILLSQTHTVPSRLIKLYTKNPYSHASIAFDERLDEMYSFARRGIWNPFNAGFIREYIHTGIFGRNVSTRCILYRLKVTDEQYSKMREIINEFNSDRMSYSYNYTGVIGVAFGYPVTKNKKFFCSQFVAYVLKNSGVEISKKIPALVTPRDIAKYDKLEVIYTGLLRDYPAYIQELEAEIV